MIGQNRIEAFWLVLLLTFLVLRTTYTYSNKSTSKVPSVSSATAFVAGGAAHLSRQIYVAMIAWYVTIK